MRVTSTNRVGSDSLAVLVGSAVLALAQAVAVETGTAVTESLFKVIQGERGPIQAPLALTLSDDPVDYKSDAEVAELADALDSGSSSRKGVEVQVLSSALETLSLTKLSSESFNHIATKVTVSSLKSVVLIIHSVNHLFLICKA